MVQAPSCWQAESTHPGSPILGLRSQARTNLECRESCEGIWGKVCPPGPGGPVDHRRAAWRACSAYSRD